MSTHAPVSPPEHTPAIDLLPLAPPYRERADLRLIALYFILLGATQVWARVSDDGELFAYFAPLFLLLGAIGYGGATLAKQTDRYAAGLLKRAQLPNTPLNHAIASKTFNERRVQSDVAITFALLAIAALLFSYFDLFWTIRPFDISTWNTSFISLVNLILFVFTALGALACGAGSSLLTTRGPLDFDELVEHESVSSLELQETDRNDIELVSMGVALSSVLRRVETYTLESTLLSALSFSALTAVIYSDLGPLESANWLAQIGWSCIDGSRYICVPRASGELLSQHAMFVTARCLLACAVFFLAVLVSRLRFNDAFRYTEELIKTAEALDRKEEDGPVALRPQITQEIGRLLNRAKHGLADLQPMVLFMKVFREMGIWSFVGAVATCGALFHWTISAAIALLFAAALFFGYADKLRRKSAFLPRLQSTIVHALQNKPGG